jgi:hypothetical protein
MRRLFLAPILVLALLTGCKDHCRQLAESLCDCAANTNEKQACLQVVANRASIISVTSAQDNDCAALQPLCDCHTVATVEGKYKCGLARVPLPP